MCRSHRAPPACNPPSGVKSLIGRARSVLRNDAKNLRYPASAAHECDASIVVLGSSCQSRGLAARRAASLSSSELARSWTFTPP